MAHSEEPESVNEAHSVEPESAVASDEIASRSSAAAHCDSQAVPTSSEAGIADSEAGY